MNTRPAFIFAVVLLLGLSGCASSGPSIGECRGELAAGILGGAIVGVLGANDVREGNASTKERVAGGVIGGVAGAGAGYAVCVSAFRQRQAIAERFASLEAELAAERASRSSAVPAPDAPGMVEASVESVTHTARVVENRVTIVTLSGPLFPSGSDEFSPLGERWLLALSDRLVDQPRNRVAIVGHTDSEGKPESNLALSQRRAQMVARYLIRQGVPAEQVQVEGRGQSEPIASNETPSGRALNRRVDFYIMPQG